MDFMVFVGQHWQLIKESPTPFVAFTLAMLMAGFSAGRLIYSSATNSAKERADTAKERLEAAWDDLARLEKRKAEDSHEIAFLKVEVDALKESFDRRPHIFSGEGPPDAKSGKDGDVYFQFGAAPSVDKTSPSQSPYRDFDPAASESTRGSATSRVQSASPDFSP